MGYTAYVKSYIIYINIISQNLVNKSGYVLMQRIFPLPQKSGNYSILLFICHVIYLLFIFHIKINLCIAFLRNGKLQILPCISELGIYGTYLSYGNLPSTTNNIDIVPTSIPLLNNYGGYLLRTKPEGVDEGGILSGCSVVSSVILE